MLVARIYLNSTKDEAGVESWGFALCEPQEDALRSFLVAEGARSLELAFQAAVGACQRLRYFGPVLVVGGPDRVARVVVSRTPGYCPALCWLDPRDPWVREVALAGVKLG